MGRAIILVHLPLFDTAEGVSSAIVAEKGLGGSSRYGLETVKGSWRAF